MMPALTPTRKRLSLCEKQKIIEERKTGIDNAVGLQQLHKIRLCLESVNSKE